MKATLFHASETLFRDSSFYSQDGKIFNKNTARENFQNGNYIEVTSFDILDDKGDDISERDALNDTYFLTQNGSRAWRSSNPTRSTSVGDIIRAGDNLYIVAACGFDKL